MRLIRIILCLSISLFVLYGCSNKSSEKPHIDDIEFKSSILDKDVKVKVYTPKGYSEDNDYPVLYFLPDYGGGVSTVMEQYAAAEKAEKLIAEGKIHPLLIATVDIERSFGINSSEKVVSFETSSGKRFNKGMYEDYICKEVIPLIDAKYSTISSKQGRYIGGYSMGGFAALHIAFRNSGLFSKVGGHSPSLFINDFPDKTVSDWLYPSDDIRKERDPIYIAGNSKLDGLEVFLDVELGGSQGVKYLYNVLRDNGIDAQYHELSLSHSRGSCYENMDKYLLFYAGMGGE